MAKREPPLKRRTEVVAAVILAVGAIVAAVVAVVPALLSGDDPAPPPAPAAVADGGSSTSRGSCVSGGVIVQGTVNCPASRDRASGARSLRLAIAPKDPDLFRVAYDHDPGLPPETARYADLLKRGGTDVTHSVQHVTLANRSDRPLTITDIKVEVVRVRPAAVAALAYAFSQGDTAYARYAARLDQPVVGATADLYGVDGNTPGYDAQPPAPRAFASRYVALKPGDVYEAEVTVSLPDTAAKLLEYRFVVSGATAERPFTIASTTLGRVTGLPRGAAYPDPVAYPHAYVYGFLGYMKRSGTNGAIAAGCEAVPDALWYAVPRTGTPGTCAEIAEAAAAQPAATAR